MANALSLLPKIPDKLPDLPTIRRKIIKSDVEDMARLMAKRLTEKGAALILGIDPAKWWQYKQRHKSDPNFEQVFERVRETQLNAHLENIQRFEQIDWRASKALLELKAPERFNERLQAVQGQVPAIYNIESMQIAFNNAYGQKPRDNAQVIDVKEQPKQIEESRYEK